jgi:hypothetical protein
MVETTLPSEGAPEPDANHVALTGNASIRSMAGGGVTLVSDTPLPLRTATDAAILSNWWDQPQPEQLPPRVPPFVGGPTGLPFSPPTTRVVSDFGAGIESTAAVSAGAAEGVGVARGVGASIAEAVGSTSTAHRIDATEGTFKISGEAPDIAHFVGHVTSRRTVIIRTVLNNRATAQLTALSLLDALDLKIETLRAGGSNSEITAFDDLKRRVEEFLAANEKTEETAIADATLSIADGLRRYWTESYGKVCDTGLLGIGLSFCAAAGALGVSDTTILAVTAIAGGNRVVDVVKAAGDLVWGKGDKS